MNRIASERKLLGISQEDFAKKIGVNASTLSKYENGASIPSELLVKMRNIFNCDLDWLLCLSDVRLSVG